ncbi:SpoIIE family protein phosphatase [Microcella humidisoli]|uniref:SpoIIE family protein phosphatase n=1 Tax=Microcella humidisoli TaxID=2963406 RepID=A0ABY5FTG4_9MICO|nr:SpoIIE family protein phosphatase [Microcella humidisoli]UTT61429.1 SpoIIE family protein phosphatase [Microcella humidisoli]
MPEVVSRTFRLNCPPDTVDTLQDLLATVWAQTPHLDPADRMAAELSIVELAANVMEHSNNGEPVSFTVSVVVYDDRIEATATDAGAVDHVDLRDRAMPDEYAERGRGLPIMQALSDSVEHRRVEGYNHWTVVRGRRHGGSPPRKAMPSISIAGVIDEMARQRALDDMGILDTPPEERFDRVTRLARQLFGVETAAVNLIDGDRQWAKSVSGLGPVEMPRDESMCTVTVQGDEPLVVPDLAADPVHAHKVVPGLLGFYAGFPLYAPGGERIGAFCVYDSQPRHFSARETEMLRDLAGWVQQELTVSQELSRASEVQQGLLPQQLLSLPGWKTAGVCIPARAVGGDFYDWYPVGEGAALTLADAMGKGIAAAIIAATVRAVLRSAARFGDVAGAVDAASAALTVDLDNAGVFVTAFHARLDMDSGVLSYVDAGHGLSIVARADGRSERLRSNAPPLGVDPETEWRVQTVHLDPGDTLIVVSDGVLDLYDGTLRSLDNLVTLALLAQDPWEIIEAIRARARGASSDDVTVLIVRRNDAD